MSATWRGNDFDAKYNGIEDRGPRLGTDRVDSGVTGSPEAEALGFLISQNQLADFAIPFSSFQFQC